MPMASVSVVTMSCRTTNLPPPCPPLTTLVAVQPSVSEPSGAARQSADHGDRHRLDEERGENLPSGETHQPQHADVAGPLGDRGEHRVHHAEDPADRHHDRHEDDRHEKLLIRGVELRKIFGLGHRLQRSLLVVFHRDRQSVGGRRVGSAEHDRRKEVRLAELRTDERRLRPNLGSETLSRRNA